MKLHTSYTALPFSSFFVFIFLIQTKSSVALFYTKARRGLWRSALAMSGVCFVWFCVALVKSLTASGRGTPVIAWNFEMITSLAGSRYFIVFWFSLTILEVAYRGMLVSRIRNNNKDATYPRSIATQTALTTQASTCNMARGLVAIFTGFVDSMGPRRPPERSSGNTLAGDVITSRRPSFMAAGMTTVQQMLEQLSPLRQQSMARGGSDYLAQPQAPQA